MEEKLLKHMLSHSMLHAKTGMQKHKIHQQTAMAEIKKVKKVKCFEISLTKTVIFFKGEKKCCHVLFKPCKHLSNQLNRVNEIVNKNAIWNALESI